MAGRWAMAIVAAAAVLAGGAAADWHDEITPGESAAMERLFDAYRESQAQQDDGASANSNTNAAPKLKLETLARMREAVRERMLAEVVAALDEEGRLPEFGDGGVTVYEFSDYRCGFCRRVFPFLDAAAARGEVRVKVVELPVLGPESLDMARAALAAWKQNKFPEYHRALMRRPPPQTKEELVRFAMELGIDEETLAAAADDEATEEMLERNFQVAALIGVRGTPAFIINNKFVAGAMSEEDFLKMIRGE